MIHFLTQLATVIGAIALIVFALATVIIAVDWAYRFVKKNWYQSLPNIEEALAQLRKIDEAVGRTDGVGTSLSYHGFAIGRWTSLGVLHGRAPVTNKEGKQIKGLNLITASDKKQFLSKFSQK